MKIWMAVALVAVGLVAAAPQARADDSEYLQALKGEYIYQQYGSQALLQEGYKVCNAIHQQHANDSQLQNMVQSDLSVSHSAAVLVVAAAEIDLGC